MVCQAFTLLQLLDRARTFRRFSAVCFTSSLDFSKADASSNKSGKSRTGCWSEKELLSQEQKASSYNNTYGTAEE